MPAPQFEISPHHSTMCHSNGKTATIPCRRTSASKIATWTQQRYCCSSQLDNFFAYSCQLFPPRSSHDVERIDACATHDARHAKPELPDVFPSSKRRKESADYSEDAKVHTGPNSSPVAAYATPPRFFELIRHSHGVPDFLHAMLWNYVRSARQRDSPCNPHAIRRKTRSLLMGCISISNTMVDCRTPTIPTHAQCSQTLPTSSLVSLSEHHT